MKPNSSVIPVRKYNQLYGKLKLLCLNTEPGKTALALTLGITIGIIPVIGFTFIIITLVGFVFRLNQFILQTVHILVSPLQIILIPVFLKLGQLIFGSPHETIIQNTSNSVPVNFFNMLSQFGHLMAYGLMVWLVLAVTLGFFLYRLLLKSRLFQDRN